MKKGRFLLSELGTKKVFAIDNGLLNAVSFKFTEDVGRCMEQVVMQELLWVLQK